jgi:mannitol 2-dehydrogenase
MKDILQEKALDSHNDPLSFLRIETIFGDLINSKRFTEAYMNALECLYHKGVIACLKG